jgi:hypothetical protein
MPAMLAFSGSISNAAGYTCHFSSECIEAEACESTSYDVSITHKPFVDNADGMDASAVWNDDATTHTLFLRKRPDILFAMWAENDGRQFGRLMTDGNAEARYVWMDVSIPMMISYFGTCEEVN